MFLALRELIIGLDHDSGRYAIFFVRAVVRAVIRAVCDPFVRAVVRAVIRAVMRSFW